jgi:uncharacterized protein with ParB-like and HNH nuclease domain
MPEETIDNNTINDLELYAVPNLYGKNFFIPDYQRGYRWGEIQVRQLIEDVTTFFNDAKTTGKFYCLQPIVVKRLTPEQVADYQLQSDLDDNTWYEVIDGQQRLTTIRIILALLSAYWKIDNLYNISYKTRPHLGSLFDNITLSSDKKNIAIANEPAILDIDMWHVKNAAHQIFNWFSKRNNIKYFFGTFSDLFCNSKEDVNKSVQVIWYELKDGSDAREIFNRLNNNKIALTNSELIRAMFLSESSEYKAEQQYADDEKDIANKLEKQRKQYHIVEQWDAIEHRLRDKRFWAFITNKDYNSYSNKIELLFDFISKKDLANEGNDSYVGNNLLSKKDKLYTFLYFDQQVKSGESLWNLWLQVERYFATISYWFEDYDFYHRIGYLVNEYGAEIVPQLLQDVATKSKTDFLNDSVIKKIGNRIDVKFNDLNYEKDSDKIISVLVLYNVELCRQNPSIGRFPFDLFKDESNSWTLEHIHAQNSEGISKSNTKAWYKWLDENISMLKKYKEVLTDDQTDKINEVDALIAQLEASAAKAKTQLSYNEIQARFNEVLNYFDRQNGNDTKDMHKLSNMTLLSGAVNTKVGNTVFEGKRQYIMQLDANGKDYIPYGTKRVFMKYHNNGEADFEVQQLYFWGKRDRQNYLREILSVTKEYLNEDNRALLDSLTNEQVSHE